MMWREELVVLIILDVFVEKLDVWVSLILEELIRIRRIISLINWIMGNNK